MREQFFGFLRKAIIIGNIAYILWILLNGINEGFGSLHIQSVPYIFLIIFLFLNSILLFRYFNKQDDSDLPGFINSLNLNKSKIAILLLIFLILSFGILYFVYLKNKYPTVPPAKSLQYTYEAFKNPHKQMEKKTIGFLPYWRLADIQYVKFDLLSEVIYFSLTANEKGDIVKVVGNETDPGWRQWNSDTVKDLVAKTQISGGKISVAIAMQKNKTIEEFLDDPSAQRNLVVNIQELIIKNKLDGINIDFEYAGELPDESYREKFTQFNSLLSSELKGRNPNIELSIDVYASSVQKPRLYDIPKLEPLFDRIVVMSYDYYGATSDVSGPVAPMYGYAEDKYYFDVSTTYSDYLKVVPNEKIIMGIPYYAWDYPVEEGDKPMSKVLPQNDENGYTSVMSYGRMRTNTDIKQENCEWDDLAKQNWCYYQDAATGKFRQIWLEDNRSIEIKYDFAKSNDLGGIAIWTLGYDKDFTDLWNMISDKFVALE
jgi:spore germination protein YaaH